MSTHPRAHSPSSQGRCRRCATPSAIRGARPSSRLSCPPRVGGDGLEPNRRGDGAPRPPPWLCWRMWTGIEPADGVSSVPTRFEAGGPTQFPDTIRSGGSGVRPARPRIASEEASQPVGWEPEESLILAVRIAPRTVCCQKLGQTDGLRPERSPRRQPPLLRPHNPPRRHAASGSPCSLLSGRRETYRTKFRTSHSRSRALEQPAIGFTAPGCDHLQLGSVRVGVGVALGPARPMPSRSGQALMASPCSGPCGELLSPVYAQSWSIFALLAWPLRLPGMPALGPTESLLVTPETM